MCVLLILWPGECLYGKSWLFPNSRLWPHCFCHLTKISNFLISWGNIPFPPSLWCNYQTCTHLCTYADQWLKAVLSLAGGIDTGWPAGWVWISSLWQSSCFINLQNGCVGSAGCSPAPNSLFVLGWMYFPASLSVCSLANCASSSHFVFDNA